MERPARRARNTRSRTSSGVRGKVGQPDGLIAQCNSATFPVPARSAEGDEERQDRQKLVVERVAIVRNAKRRDRHDRPCARSGQVDCQERSGSGGDGWLPKTPEDRVAVCWGTAQIARSSRDTAPHPTCTNNQSCPVV
jgi:hypothetical protein